MWQNRCCQCNKVSYWPFGLSLCGYAYRPGSSFQFLENKPLQRTFQIQPAIFVRELTRSVTKLNKHYGVQLFVLLSIYNKAMRSFNYVSCKSHMLLKEHVVKSLLRLQPQISTKGRTSIAFPLWTYLHVMKCSTAKLEGSALTIMTNTKYSGLETAPVLFASIVIGVWRKTCALRICTYAEKTAFELTYCF